MHVVGECCENTPHNFTGSRLWHIRNYEDPSRARDLANHGFNGLVDLVQNRRAGLYARLQGDIDFGHAALDFVHHGHHRGFCHLGNRQAGRLDFLCAQAVTSHVDDVIHAPQNPEIAVRGQHGSVRRKIWPVMPVFAVAVLAVFAVVLCNEAVAIAPNSLHDPRPGIADADVACLA